MQGIIAEKNALIITLFILFIIYIGQLSLMFLGCKEPLKTLLKKRNDALIVILFILFINYLG